MKLTVIANRMNTKDMSKAKVLKRIKLQNPIGKKIRTLTGIKRKLIKIYSKENKKNYTFIYES